eukprot:4204001-Pyramimonas_sp.AAC.1
MEWLSKALAKRRGFSIDERSVLGVFHADLDFGGSIEFAYDLKDLKARLTNQSEAESEDEQDYNIVLTFSKNSKINHHGADIDG